ncbi:MAG: hypothetical protein H0V03_06985 [Thermoleophilaceae bacterium]|nr:hypothetical protein [Thermoleophilaceae bacterium]
MEVPSSQVLPASQSEARFRANRLRWRLRGAWTWPVFALVTVADALVMRSLPPIASGIRLVPALIVSAAANLFLVGALAPWLSRRLAARERLPRGTLPPPAEIRLDRVATGLLLAGVLGVVAAGLAARPLTVSETVATEANATAVRDYVLANGSEEYQRNLGSANTIRLGEGYFRTCVSADERSRALCLFVDTNRRPVDLRRDRSTEPNEQWLGRGGTP